MPSAAAIIGTNRINEIQLKKKKKKKKSGDPKNQVI